MIRLMRSLVMSIFLHACKTWSFAADIERRIQAIEMRCFRKLISISYRDHINDKKEKPELKTPSGHTKNSGLRWKDAN